MVSSGCQTKQCCMSLLRYDKKGEGFSTNYQHQMQKLLQKKSFAQACFLSCRMVTRWNLSQGFIEEQMRKWNCLCISGLGKCLQELEPCYLALSRIWSRENPCGVIPRGLVSWRLSGCHLKAFDPMVFVFVVEFYWLTGAPSERFIRRLWQLERSNMNAFLPSFFWTQMPLHQFDPPNCGLT